MTKDKKPVVKTAAEQPQPHDISKNRYRCENCKAEIVGAGMQKHNLEHKGQVIRYTLLH